ncbi:MAG: hypothetical protein ACFFG0_07400 [Candidatus Thorarchaeota archaeon]
MKKINKILSGSFALVILFAILITNTVLAAETSIEINDNTYQTQIEANNRVMFTFQQRTRLTFNSTVDIDVNINCEALMIGVKFFEIDLDCDQDLLMNMTCTEEQNELGLLMGHRYTVRNRHRYLYQEGFCISLQCNNSGEIQAKLKIQANNRNREGRWAYYNESSEEWVTEPTRVEDGYLITETDHFSSWTILIPESENNMWIYIGLIIVVGILAVISVLFIVYRRKK